MTTPPEKTTTELMADAQAAAANLDDRLLRRLDALEQVLAESGVIPAARCPRCHGTGVVPLHRADTEPTP